MQTYGSKQHTHVQKKGANTSASIFDNSSRSESLQRKADLANVSVQREKRPNNTGMPDNLKAGIECLSGFSMDNVRVHYNSSKPATVQALAYTQGTDIHVAPGQEKCLPHEAWHVAQQMAGRVSPTTNINGMPVNDNTALEHEADVMGEKAVQCKTDTSCGLKHASCQNTSLQRYVKVGEYVLSKEKDGIRKIAVKENEASTIYIYEGESIPEDLEKLGIVASSEEPSINNFKYKKLQQGRVSENQSDVLGDDKVKTESLLNEQYSFVCSVFDLNEKMQKKEERKSDIRSYLLFLIDCMLNSVPLKCLGSDIVDAVFAMYKIVNEESPMNSLDNSVLCIIKDDLKLRLSQIENEIRSAGLKPFFRTACDASAYDRSFLINGNLNGYKEKKDHIETLIPKESRDMFNLGWDGHRGSYIGQNLSDDCLYIEDAVGKASGGQEHANAHWFAHIYGTEEPSREHVLPANGDTGFPYQIGASFPMNNNFNLVETADIIPKIGEKIGESWCETFEKNIKLDNGKVFNLFLKLDVKLNEQCKFEGSFNCKNLDTVTLNNDNKCYIAGVMDFMVQTANSAIDGMLVGSLSKDGFEKYKTDESNDNQDLFTTENPTAYVMKSLNQGRVTDRSLFSIYKLNLTPQEK